MGGGGVHPFLRPPPLNMERIMTKRHLPPLVNPQGLCMDKGYDEIETVGRGFDFTARIHAQGGKKPGQSNGNR